ncbi:MAG: type II toxin-antitoxin system VapC family toxin [Deltaproteobacteria bacterium]|nr:type II toxin-antitoxin system VapC family toxin [Deltaproteobacteria bacterium]
MKKSFVLDACALIAFFNDEEGAGKVEELLRGAKEKKFDLSMNKINILEIYYGVYREVGFEASEEVLAKIRKLPITIVDKLEDSIFKESGRIKATYRVSLADCVAIAEAKVRGAKLATADHHEFDLLEKEGEVGLYWIR